MIASGALVKVYINGKLVPEITGIAYTINTPRSEIFALDSILPYELVPTHYKVSGSINFVKRVGDGGIEGKGMMAFAQDLLREKYFTIQVITRAGDVTLFKSDQNSVQSQSWQMMSKSVIVGQVTFTGFSYANEIDLSTYNL